MAQAVERFLDLALELRAMRREASWAAMNAGIPCGVEALCLLFHAAKVGRKFCAEEVVLAYEYNCTRAVRLLIEAGVLASAGRARADLRKKPLQITERGIRVVAQLEQAMSHIVARERLAA